MTDVLVATTSAFWEIGPDDEVPFVFNWNAWLADGDSVSTFDITLPAGLDPVPGQSDQQISPGRIQFWCTLTDPDTIGDTFEVACQINTTQGMVKTRRRRVKAVLR